MWRSNAIKYLSFRHFIQSIWYFEFYWSFFLCPKTKIHSKWMIFYLAFENRYVCWFLFSLSFIEGRKKIGMFVFICRFFRLPANKYLWRLFVERERKEQKNGRLLIFWFNMSWFLAAKAISMTANGVVNRTIQVVVAGK